MKSTTKTITTALMLLFLTNPAWAHKLNLFAYSEAGRIYIESYFVDGKRPLDSSVKVFDPDGKLLVSGKTDVEGQYDFPIPDVTTDLKIVVNAGMGHQVEYVMPANEASAISSPKGPGSSAADESGSEATGMVSSELQAAVDAAVKRAIKPLIRELAESRQHAGMTEIIGGIGYILGILGLWAYITARKTITNPQAE